MPGEAGIFPFHLQAGQAGMKLILPWMQKAEVHMEWSLSGCDHCPGERC